MEVRECAVTRLAREVAALPVVTRTPGEVLAAYDEWERVLRVGQAAQAECLAELERLGVPAEQGARNTQAWVAQRSRISPAEAKTRVTVARAITQDMSPTTGEPLPAELPATALALREGEIGLEQASVIAAGVRKITGILSPRQCEQAEAFLVEQARVLGPREVRTLAERVAYHADQDGAYYEEERQHEDRELRYAVAPNGMTVLKGRLDRESGAKLRAALEPLAAPRPATNGEQDPRTAAQRNADALEALVDIALSTNDLPRAGGQRPHLTVTIPLDSLRKQCPDTDHTDDASTETPRVPGVLETTGQPLTAGQIRRMACDAHVLPVVLGGDSQPLDVGRAHRTAPTAIRAALITRDGTCAFPHCDHPPGTSEAHHLVSWADGGDTAITNMVMLCPRHHRIVHNQGWDIDLTTSRPLFIPPTTLDAWQRPRPGNTPHHQLDLTSFITSDRENPHDQKPLQLEEFTIQRTQQLNTTTTNEPTDPTKTEEPSPPRPPPE